MTRRGGRCSRCCCWPRSERRVSGGSPNPGAAGGARGLSTSGTRCSSVWSSRNRARSHLHALHAPHPGSVQRVRRPDHVAELRLRSGGAESRAEEGLVCRACRSRSAADGRLRSIDDLIGPHVCARRSDEGCGVLAAWAVAGASTVQCLTRRTSSTKSRPRVPPGSLNSTRGASVASSISAASERKAEDVRRRRRSPSDCHSST